MTDKKVKTKKTNEELEYPIYLFNEGTNSDAFRLMRPTDMGDGTWRFRVWAPNAQSVSVVGEFNGWDRSAAPMKRIGGGIWEARVGGVKTYDIYKFSVCGADGVIHMKADPYCPHTETPPGNASKLFDLEGFGWTDAAYMEAQNGRNEQEAIVDPQHLMEISRCAGNRRRPFFIPITQKADS